MPSSAVLALSLLARLVAWRMGYFADPWSYRFFPFELALFAAGALSHQWLLPLAERASGLVVSMVTGAMLGLAAASTALPLVEPARSVLVFGAAFLALPFLFRFQRTRRWDALLGELSYPIYLAHWAVAMVVLEVSHRLGWTTPPFFSAIVVLGAFAAALALDVAVVRPVERLRRRVKRSPHTPDITTPPFREGGAPRRA